MPPSAMPDMPSLLQARIRVPRHVVYRAFPSETVVLNLHTGKYHGLNTTAGMMLEALERASTLRDAAEGMAADCDQPQELVERDMCELCRQLLDRQLVEIDGDPTG